MLLAALHQVAQGLALADAGRFAKSGWAPHRAKPYICSRSFYISPTGSDSHPGTVEQPFQTINHALALEGLTGGDCVIATPGTYVEQVVFRRTGTGDRPDGYVTLVSEVSRAAKIRPPEERSDDWNTAAVYIGAYGANAYIIVDGFDISTTAPAGHAGIYTGLFIHTSHHVTIMDSVVHNVGRGGIEGIYSDYVKIDSNLVFNTSGKSISSNQTSAISLYQARAWGDAEGWRNVIRNNITFGSMRENTGAKDHTDGNGIIVDDFRHTQNNSGEKPYRYPTLIENNLSFDNGGSGIHVYFSDGVTVRNNTVANNNLDPENIGTYRGGLSNIMGSENTWANNISLANSTANSHNTAMADVSLVGKERNRNVQWLHNLVSDRGTRNRLLLLRHTDSDVSKQQGNLLGADPKFVAAADGNFHLRSNSPAIAAGTASAGVPEHDLNGRPRPQGKPDLGALGFSRP